MLRPYLDLTTQYFLDYPMLKPLVTWRCTMFLPPLRSHNIDSNSVHSTKIISSNNGFIILQCKRFPSVQCNARRRIRDDDNEDEDYGRSEELALLEIYSQNIRDEALLVKAIVDEEEVEVLIFKGFSSCLSYKTASDPSKSVLPTRAVIICIDRIKGPFDPANIEYLERALTWKAFNTRITNIM